MKILLVLYDELHVKPFMWKEEWNQAGILDFYSKVARSILNFSSRHPEAIVIWRESPAQHFPVESGAFEDIGHKLRQDQQEAMKDTHGNCQQVMETTYKSDSIPTALNGLDPRWMQLLGFVPLFNETARYFYDLHSPHVKEDCSHFIYIPGVFSFLWDQLEQEVTRIAKLKKMRIH